MKRVDVTSGFAGSHQREFLAALLGLHLQHSAPAEGAKADVQWSMWCSRVGDLRALCDAFIRTTNEHIQEVRPWNTCMW